MVWFAVPTLQCPMFDGVSKVSSLCQKKSEVLNNAILFLAALSDNNSTIVQRFSHGTMYSGLCVREVNEAKFDSLVTRGLLSETYNTRVPNSMLESGECLFRARLEADIE